MRLGIFLGCIGALIMVSRWYSIPAEAEGVGVSADAQLSSQSLAEPERQQPAIAPAVSAQPAMQALASAYSKPISRKPFGNDPQSASSQPSTAILSGTFQPSPFTLPTELQEIANNVQLLVRAEYRVPSRSVEAIMNLAPDALVEIERLDAEESEVATIQVTTDEKTQRAFCGLLSAIYKTAQASDSDSGMVRTASLQ